MYINVTLYYIYISFTIWFFPQFRCSLWGMCPRLLWQPLSAWRALPAMPVQQQHRHVRHGCMWQADWTVQEMPVQHWRPKLWHLQEWLFWGRFPTQLQESVTCSFKNIYKKHLLLVSVILKNNIVMKHFCLFALQSAHVTSWVLNAASVWSVRTVCASASQASASVYQTS